MAEILTQGYLYELMKTEVQLRDPSITDFTEGSLTDVILGATSLGIAELSRLQADEFAKTFFDSANGPEITGGDDDLQTLAVDHFGDAFSRPPASKAVGEVTFSRPTDDFGAVTIPAGTVVSTKPNANGEVQRFETLASVTMGALALSIIAEIQAQVAGVSGNVDAGKIVNVDSALLDGTIVVTNAAALDGGEEQEDDTQYRATIKNLIKTLKGATLSAIEAACLTVPGIATATARELMIPVIQYDIGGDQIEPGATFFRMPFAKVYVADPNGTASASLLAEVQDAIDHTRAAGVKIEAFAASALTLNWSASVVLNPSGPNYTELSTNLQKIVDSMKEYIMQLPIGDDFNRALGENFVMAAWGPLGTNDLISFTTNSPTGSVSTTASQKLVAGTVEII